MAAGSFEKCDLLVIPLELRLKIYNYVFDDVLPVIYPYNYNRRHHGPEPSLCLLQTNHQIRYEALPVLRAFLERITLHVECWRAAYNSSWILQECSKTCRYVTGDLLHAYDIVAAFPNFESLEKVTIDLSGCSDPHCSLPINLEDRSKEEWLKDEYDANWADGWVYHVCFGDPEDSDHDDEKRWILCEIPDEIPSFKVEVVMAFQFWKDVERGAGDGFSNVRSETMACRFTAVCASSFIDIHSQMVLADVKSKQILKKWWDEQ